MKKAWLTSGRGTGDPDEKREPTEIAPVLRAFAKGLLGVPSEDFAKLTSREERAHKNVGEKMVKCRLMAEVVVG